MCIVDIAGAAYETSLRRDASTPWSVSLLEEQGVPSPLARVMARGGKLDDITAVVAVVRE